MKNWIVKESNFQKHYLRKYESILCQGNGYMGIRAATEESYEKNIRYTLVAGTFDWAEQLNTTELPNAADVTACVLKTDGISMHLTKENVQAYERSLNLHNGLLRRNFIWIPRKDLHLEFCSERFVSLKERHVIGQRISVKVLKGKTTLEVSSGITGGKRYGEPHFIHMQGFASDGIMQYVETTHESNISFVTSAVVNAWFGDAEDTKKAVELHVSPGQEGALASCQVVLEEGQEFGFEKLCRIATTRDKEFELWDKELLLEREKEAIKNLQNRGYEDVWAQSRECWEALWHEKDIEISGDADRDQLAVRFAIYHLTVMAPVHDNRMNIGAKGLSGKGYFGHTFWDTEIYMLPYFVWTDPKAARSLLEYRYQCLDSARAEAKACGCEGAKYPWEAAWITDQDVCPEKHFTKHEIHVTADVAYGVTYYYDITQDMDFMRKCGCEILFETAQYWKSRLEYRAEKDVYELCDVIGPDEFTHNADNNAYTNYLVQLNLQQAVQWANRLEKEYPQDYKRLDEQLDLAEKTSMWLDVQDKIVLQLPNEDLVLPQDSTYLELPEINLDIYRRGERKLRVDYPYPTYTRLKVSKQADVMNLFLLREELFTDEVKRASLDYYEPYCVHESSLSLCAYSMLAADCGEQAKAYELFERAREIDLDLEKDSNHGIHAASLGGIWQCCVRGFAGVRLRGGELVVQPHLPDGWDKVTFCIWWRNRRLKISATKEAAEIEVLEGQDYE